MAEELSESAHQPPEHVASIAQGAGGGLGQVRQAEQFRGTLLLTFIQNSIAQGVAGSPLPI